MIAMLQHRIESWRFRRRYNFPEVRLDDILPQCGELLLDLRDWNSDKRAGDFHDGVVITAIVRALQPKLYWEIGTGDGRTALLAARNTEPEATICTLDSGYPSDSVKGYIFRGRPEAAKITQFGDYSTRFDFSPWFGKADLVFVDGSHQFADVLNDSEVAFKLVALGGWVLWHDVAIDTPGVPEALKQCSRAKQIERVAGSRYALYRDRSIK